MRFPRLASRVSQMRSHTRSLLRRASMESEGPPDFFAQPDTGASQPPEETANPFGAPAPQGSTGVEVPQTSPDQDPAPPGPEPTGPMDPDLFTAPAADSYAPAGTGTDGHPAETGANCRSAAHMLTASTLPSRGSASRGIGARPAICIQIDCTAHACSTATSLWTCWARLERTQWLSYPSVAQ